MKTTGRERWVQLWTAAELDGDPAGWYERLIALYSEPHRHYHTLRHIGECLNQFDAANDLARQPVAVELAIWFHDAIYDPRSSDNEERSAALARECLAESSAGKELLELVARLVLATKHHVPSDHADSLLLLDVDLSILGQPEERFQEYERQIWLEYAWVPESVFAAKRAGILANFLRRERIYQTDYFCARFEQQARQNIRHSLERPGALLH